MTQTVNVGEICKDTNMVGYDFWKIVLFQLQGLIDPHLYDATLPHTMALPQWRCRMISYLCQSTTVPDKLMEITKECMDKNIANEAIFNPPHFTSGEALTT